jgi:hypothetical protein
MTILRHNPGVTGAMLDDFLAHVHPDSPLIGCGQLWVNAGLRNNIDPVYLMAHACVESAWGYDQIAPYNIYGYGAYDSDPVGGAYHFTSYQDCIDKVSNWIREDYLDPTGWYYTQFGPTLQGMNVNYATSQTWRYTICSIMNWFAGGVSSYDWPGYTGYPYPPTYGIYDAIYETYDSRVYSDSSRMKVAGRQTYEIMVAVTNGGQINWNASGANRFYLGYYWLKDGVQVSPGAVAAYLPSNVGVGQTAFLKARVQAPNVPGSGHLVFDMIRDGYGWFSAYWVPVKKIPTVVCLTEKDPAKIKTVSSSELAGYGNGDALRFRPGTLVKGSGSGVYATECLGGVYFRRVFSSGDDFNALGYNWDDIVTITDADLGSYTLGDPVSTLAHANGALVKMAASDSVYFLENMQRRSLTYASFVANGFRWDRVFTVSTDEMARYTDGAPYPMRPGTLVKGSAASVFVTDLNGASPIRHSIDYAAFTGLGYRWEDIITLSDSELNTYVEGSPVAGTATHPNGTLVRSSTDPGSVYLLEAGLKRRLDPYLYTDSYIASYTSGFDSAELTTVVKNMTINLPVSLRNDGYLPWPAGGTSLSYQWINVDTGVVTDGVTTAISGGVSSGGSANLTAAVQTPISTGTYVIKWDILRDGAWMSASGASAVYAVSTARPPYPDGSLVKSAASAAVYLVDQGRKRAITSGTVFVANNLKWDRIRTVSASELSYYPAGEELKARPGTLIKGSSPAVYITDSSAGGQIKRFITSAEAFLALGLHWEDIITLSDTEVAGYAPGTPLSSAATHPNGMFVKTAALATVYMLEAGEKRPLTYLGFVTNGYRWDRVVTIPQGEMDGYAAGDPLQACPGTLIKGTEAVVYDVAIEGGNYVKRPFGSQSAFFSLGFSFADLYVLSNGELTTYLTSSNVID